MIRSAYYHICNIAAWAIVCAFFLLSEVDAFVPTHQKPACRSSHHMAGFLDDVGKFFDGLGGNNNDDDRSVDAEIVEDIDGAYTGSKRIITIPGELCNNIM